MKQASASLGSEETTRAQSSEIAKWQSFSSEVRVKSKIGRESNPLKARQGLKGLCPRMQDVANVVYLKTRMRLVKEENRYQQRCAKALRQGRDLPERPRYFMHEAFVDLTQAVQRVNPAFGFAPNHKAALMYSLEHDCCMPGSVHLAALGYPKRFRTVRNFGNNEHHENTLLKGFSGQAMSLPCLTSCIAAYFLTAKAPWWH